MRVRNGHATKYPFRCILRSCERYSQRLRVGGGGYPAGRNVAFSSPVAAAGDVAPATTLESFDNHASTAAAHAHVYWEVVWRLPFRLPLLLNPPRTGFSWRTLLYQRIE